MIVVFWMKIRAALGLTAAVVAASAIAGVVCCELAAQDMLAPPAASKGRDYCVDRNNPRAGDNNQGTEASPWKSIAKANQTLEPGDTVHIKEGVYNEWIEPRNSGTADRRITYRNFGNDKVTIAEASRGIPLKSKAYITVHGISFSKLDQFLWLDNASHNIIAYCTFDQMRRRNWSGSKIYKNSQYNWVHHCSFSRWGYYTDDDIGCVLDIGNEEDQADFTKYNLVEHNAMFYGGHHVLGIYGSYNVIRNNYFHNENWSDDWGDRNLSLNGHESSSGRNLIEGNRIAFSGFPPDNTGASGMSMATRRNIVRFNCFYGNNSAGLMLSVTSSYPNSPCFNRICHNTFFQNGYISAKDTTVRYKGKTPGKEQQCGLGFAHYDGPRLVTGNAVKNNIFHGQPTAYGSYRVNLADQTIAGNWEEAGDPLFVDVKSPLDPRNPDIPDLHLRPGSPCVDKGVFLTKVAAPDGSGKTLKVEDAGFFMDGWGVVEGDRIQLQGNKQAVRVTKVDYETHTLTVESELSWRQNQGVTLAYDGLAPDVGAFELTTKVLGSGEKVSGQTEKPSTSQAKKPPLPAIKAEVLAPWEAKLAERIAQGIKEGQRPTATMRAMGSREEPVKVVGADGKSLSVEIQGSALSLPWARVSAGDRANLARAFLKEENIEDQLLVAVFALADGRADLSDEHFAKAKAADPKGGEARVAEVRASLGSR